MPTETLTKKYDSSEVGNALMAKLYSIVSGAELSGGEPLMHNKFVSWYCPGIPFTGDTFDSSSRTRRTRSASCTPAPR